MTTPIANAFLDSLADLAGSDCKVYLVVCRRINSTEAGRRSSCCTLSIGDISRDSGLRRATAIAALRHLVDKKLLGRTPGKGTRPDTYELIVANTVPLPVVPSLPRASEKRTSTDTAMDKNRTDTDQDEDEKRTAVLSKRFPPVRPTGTKMFSLRPGTDILVESE